MAELLMLETYLEDFYQLALNYNAVLFMLAAFGMVIIIGGSILYGILTRLQSLVPLPLKGGYALQQTCFAHCLPYYASVYYLIPSKKSCTKP